MSALPAWIDPEIWEAFKDMRKAKGKRAVLTKFAENCILYKCYDFHSKGHDVNGILTQSIINAWSDIYPEKDKPTPVAPSAIVRNDFLASQDALKAELSDPEVAERARQARLAVVGRHLKRVA